MPPVLDHLTALTDDVGVIQHAVFDVPNRSTGYCTDDVARAFCVAVAASQHGALRSEALRLGRIYLAFLHDAQLPDGRFHNFLSYDRRWLDEIGTDDSIGRAVWALGYGVRFAPLDGWRELCRGMLAAALPAIERLGFPRSRAYAALGLAHAAGADVAERWARDERAAIRRSLRAIGDDLLALRAASAAPGWDWFEDAMTYDNARLCEALIRIGTVLDDTAFLDAGLATAAFYESVVIERGMLVPIGNDGWYPRGGPRSRFAQQPLEAAAVVDLGLAAYAATGALRHRRLAETGLAWFRGKNSQHTVMTENGGCRDGLDERGANRNMGAESTLAYLASTLSLARAVSADSRPA